MKVKLLEDYYMEMRNVFNCFFFLFQIEIAVKAKFYHQWVIDNDAFRTELNSVFWGDYKPNWVPYYERPSGSGSNGLIELVGDKWTFLGWLWFCPKQRQKSKAECWVPESYFQSVEEKFKLCYNVWHEIHGWIVQNIRSSYSNWARVKV